MQYIKAKFLRDDKPMGKAYTYKASDDVKAGDIVKNVNGTKLVVLDEPVDEKWIQSYGTENIATVEKYVKKENDCVDEGKSM